MVYNYYFALYVLKLIAGIFDSTCEWTAGPLTSATCPPIFIQFTDFEMPIKRFYWPENAIGRLG